MVSFFFRLLAYKLLALTIFLAILGTTVSYYVSGPHQAYVQVNHIILYYSEHYTYSLIQSLVRLHRNLKHILNLPLFFLLVLI